MLRCKNSLSFLQAFDRAMNHLDKAFGFVDSSQSVHLAQGALHTFCSASMSPRGSGGLSVLDDLASRPAKAAVSLKHMALAMSWPHVRLIMAWPLCLPAGRL